MDAVKAEQPNGTRVSQLTDTSNASTTLPPSDLGSEINEAIDTPTASTSFTPSDLGSEIKVAISDSTEPSKIAEDSASVSSSSKNESRQSENLEKKGKKLSFLSKIKAAKDELKEQVRVHVRAQGSKLLKKTAKGFGVLGVCLAKWWSEKEGSSKKKKGSSKSTSQKKSASTPSPGQSTPHEPVEKGSPPLSAADTTPAQAESLSAHIPPAVKLADKTESTSATPVSPETSTLQGTISQTIRTMVTEIFEQSKEEDEENNVVPGHTFLDTFYRYDYA